LYNGKLKKSRLIKRKIAVEEKKTFLLWGNIYKSFILAPLTAGVVAGMIKL
jgi:hypothetical protein